MNKLSILSFDEIYVETLKEAARNMLIAAKTAPKGRGIDNIEGVIILDKGIKQIAKKMIEIGKRDEQSFFIRDANCILQSPVLLLLGTKIKPLGLKKCGLCGFNNCTEKENYTDTPCAFNTGDLGIAIGSAVSVAMDKRVDNRIMFSVGMAAKELKIMGSEIKIIFGIPLSAKGKNPFFDRG